MFVLDSHLRLFVSQCDANLGLLSSMVNCDALVFLSLTTLTGTHILANDDTPYTSEYYDLFFTDNLKYYV
jgi:hypothetical protein